MQESFTYFKIFKPISWDKRPAERRSRLIQRFPSIKKHASLRRRQRRSASRKGKRVRQKPEAGSRLHAAKKRRAFFAKSNENFDSQIG